MNQLDMNFVAKHIKSAAGRHPDFENIKTVLLKKAPSRHTLFEFFMNDNLYRYLTKRDTVPNDSFEYMQMMIEAYKVAGYDYCTLQGSDFGFHRKDIDHKKSISLNEGVIIYDEESYENYRWLEPEDFNYCRLNKLKLPDGMKIILSGPGGVLENVIALVGFDNLCYMIADNPDLLVQIFKDVGSRLLKYYEICAGYDSVGALISNDDWGFNTQTMISVDDMRKYVFPWHQKIAKAAHNAGKPLILHFCGKKRMQKEWRTL